MTTSQALPMAPKALKVAYLVPDGQYSFFRQLVEPLRGYDVYCRVNDGLDDADVVLAGILPTDHRWTTPLAGLLHPSLRRGSGGPKVVLWHWDFYSFTDYSEDRWDRFLKLLPQADRVWSCTYEVARQLKEIMNLDSAVVPAWVDESEFGAPTPSHRLNDEVLYAVSGGGFGKRPEWAERACRILGLPCRILRGQSLPRDQYLDLVRRCRVYCMTAFEESNATIPAMEAGAAGRPVVLSDLPSSREVFGAHGYYFAPNDFAGLVKAVGAAWRVDGARPEVRERILDGYGLAKVARLAARQLWEVYRDALP